MTWHTVVATKNELQRLLATIRDAGGVVTRCFPCPVGVEVTYVTLRE